MLCFGVSFIISSFNDTSTGFRSILFATLYRTLDVGVLFADNFDTGLSNLVPFLFNDGLSSCLPWDGKLTILGVDETLLIFFTGVTTSSRS